MTPNLTRSGLSISISAVFFLMVGVVTGSWTLTALGTFVVCLLMASLVFFYPKAVAVRRRKLELAWWVPGWKLVGGVMTPKTPFPLQIFLRNRSNLHLGRVQIRPVGSSAVEIKWPPPTLKLPRKSQVSTQAVVVVTASGHWFLHGAAIELTDGLGLYKVEAYFPSPLELTVFPQLTGPSMATLDRTMGFALHERAGVHKLKLRGFGGQLREIRDHRPGDSFKQIAWKPTARLRKLMVKEYESEILMTHYLLLDISSSMRDTMPGSSKLDYAVDFCASFARNVLTAGDRLGIITFDSRIYGHLKPGDGHAHLYRIIDHLMELHHVVDEDLTDVTDMELVEAVAEYMLFQEGTESRIRFVPPRGSPRWKDLLPGTQGQLYHSRILATWANKVLARHAASSRTKHKPLPDPRFFAENQEMGKLRACARLVGIELPFRPRLLPGSKERGMIDAVKTSTAFIRSQLIYLVTDLMGISPSTRLYQALQLARRRHHRIAVLCPFAPRFLPEPEEDERSVILHDIFKHEELRQIEPMLKELGRLGIPVYMGSPSSTVSMALGQVQRLKQGASGRVA